MGVRYRLTTTRVKGLTAASQPKATSPQGVVAEVLVEITEMASKSKRQGRKREVDVLLRVCAIISHFSAKEAEEDLIRENERFDFFRKHRKLWLTYPGRWMTIR